MSAEADLDRMIATIRRLPKALENAAPEAMAAADKALRAELAKGGPPGGGTWEPLKVGGPALVNAATGVVFRPQGLGAVWETRFPYQFHQTGAGLPQRRVLPIGDASPSMKAATKEVLIKAFNAAKVVR